MKASEIIAKKLGLTVKHVAAVLSLYEEGATVPFIARYRKEQTGSMDEVQISSILAESDRLNELLKRKETVLHTIEELGKMTDELRRMIDECTDATTLEDIYLPYKPHRKTRADIAKEHGLEKLAKQLMAQSPAMRPKEIARSFLNKDVTDVDAALQGARDIIAEWVSESANSRNAVRREFDYSAMLTCKVTRGKADEEEAQQYRDYFDVHERLSRIRSHRLLAMRRGETEGWLKVDISPDYDKAIEKLTRKYVHGSGASSKEVETALEDSYKRLLKPSIETEYAASSKEKADEEAIKIFADNARQLLMAAPLGQKRVLALDPGYRTGCKLVCLSPQGDLLYHTVIFPAPPRSDVAGATQTLTSLIDKYNIEAIAIGNGTASRETEDFVHRTLDGFGYEDVDVYVVSENGASVYSASEIAREEFPDEDITVRGAVSIGRRLQDPLAELVKIDPKSIGVGQYQHDVDQTKLRNALSDTVFSAVNQVGVDVNTASKHLLTYISGLGPVLAGKIVEYRSANGPFRSRKELLNVPKLGAKTFEQCAGFLRVTDSDNPLDNTAVHPERYALVAQIAGDQGCSVAELVRNGELLDKVNIEKYVSGEVGIPTLKDIIRELKQPARDPRGKAEVFRFSDEVHEIGDLRIGMVLPGIVTNITAFGAFVDIGVHQDGLIHVSRMKGRTLSLHQTLHVVVEEIDVKRRRISLSFYNE